MKTISSKFSSSGFTLIELLAVIVLIALIIGVGIPRLNQITTVNLRSAARSVAGLIKITYNRAAMAGEEYRLAFDLDTQAYWLEVLVVQESEEKESEEERKKIPKRVFVRTKRYLAEPAELPAGVAITRYFYPEKARDQSNGTVYLHFYPNGEMSGGYLFFNSSEDTAVTLQINPLTGRVKSHRGVLDVANTT